MKRSILHIFLIVLLLFKLSFSVSYISEIDFGDNEFIEIYSDGNLNFDGAKVFDDAGKSKANTLSLESKKTSNYYLIAGNNFIDSNDLNSLNCSIYSTSKTNIGYYGLKSSGENITIILNTTNLSWFKDKNYDFNLDESLNYNTSTKNYQINTISPCSNIKVEKNNKQEQKDENKEYNSKICNSFLNIIPKKNFFENKIEYYFQTDATDYNIEYWIEDFEGNIVKKKLNTSNTNTKSYSPKDYSNIYILNAILHTSNCNLHVQNKTFFYSKHKTCPECIKCDLKSNCETNDEILENEISYIKILNEKELSSGSTSNLEYEIYKGNSRKRVVYFYLNNEKINSIDLNQYTKIKGRIFLENYNLINNFTISGLNLTQTILFNKGNLSLLKQQKNFNSDFKIPNIIQLNNKINFVIKTNLDNFTSNCYIYLNKTKISNEISTNLSGNFELTIDVKKLNKKSKNSNSKLKLICKYKKSNLKTFKYENVYFDFIQNFDNISNTRFNINPSYLISSNNSNTFFAMSSSKTQMLVNSSTNNNNNNNYFEYESDQKKLKNNSYFFVFLGVSLIMILMLLKW